MDSALADDVMESYLTRKCDKKIRNGYVTLETMILLSTSRIIALVQNI